MDSTLIAAIVGALCMLAVPFITWKLGAENQQKRFTTISASRLHHIRDSVWEGYHEWSRVEEPHGGPDDPVEPAPRRREQVRMTVSFRVKGKLITGKGNYSHETVGKTEILLRGGFVSDDFLKLDYYNADTRRLHFGTMILKMDADCSTLKGGIMAYGRKPDRIYTGIVFLGAS